LADDLLNILGKANEVETEKYTPPKRDDNLSVESVGDKNAKYFKFEEVTGGMSIVGLSESGKNQKNLTLPREYEGKPVVLIGDNAFANSKVLKRVIIGEDSTIKSFSSDALSNCPSLRAIEIHLEPSTLPINPEAVMKMPKDCRIYIPEDKYSDFATDYFWIAMMQYVETLE
jgi:hypothetical protein